MDPILCPNCRLPIRPTAGRCPHCATVVRMQDTVNPVPVAAALAVVATWTLLLRRRAA